MLHQLDTETLMLKLHKRPEQRFLLIKFQVSEEKRPSLPTCSLLTGVVFGLSWSCDVQTGVGSTACFPPRSSPRLCPLAPAIDWTTAPLPWTRLPPSWTGGRKSSPGAVGRWWVAAASKRPGCGSDLNWGLGSLRP